MAPIQGGSLLYQRTQFKLQGVGVRDLGCRALRFRDVGFRGSVFGSVFHVFTPNPLEESKQLAKQMMLLDLEHG